MSYKQQAWLQDSIFQDQDQEKDSSNDASLINMIINIFY